MPTLAHVTVEIPLGYLKKAGDWYERFLGLTFVDNPDPHVVWFEEGIHLIGVGRWESHVAYAHFALSLGGLYEPVHAMAARHVVDSEEWESRYFIRDPWGNRIECVR